MNKREYIHKQKKVFSRQLIDRRQFIMSVIAAGLSIPAALSLADSILANTPKKGGLFRMATAHGSTSDSLDPGTAENGFTQILQYTYANYLTEIDSNGTLIGELAKNYEATNKGKTWIFNLHKDICFHNGKVLNADDVIASLNYHMNKFSKSAARGLLTQIVSIKKSSNYQVIINLSNPNADFAYVVSDYHIPILPNKDGTIDPNAGIGTGGYIIEKYEPGVRVSFKKNPNYFRSDRAHFDKIEILSIVDATARQSAIMNNEIDHADQIAPKVVRLLQHVPTLRIIEIDGSKHYTMPMRLDTKPFDNYNLRMALKLSVKRQELVDKILLGHGKIGNDLPISSNMIFYNRNLSQRCYDPDKAAFYFRKSGFEGVLSLSTSEAAFPGANDAAQLISAAAIKAGISVKVIREPNDGYWVNVWNKKGWCTCYWSGRPTQDTMYSSAYTDDTEWNDTAWKNTKAAKRFNKLVRFARGEIDQNKRKSAYFEAQALLHDDGGALIPVFANYIHATSKKIAIPNIIATNWENDGNHAPERWWFA